MICIFVNDEEQGALENSEKGIVMKRIVAFTRDDSMSLSYEQYLNQRTKPDCQTWGGVTQTSVKYQ